MLAQLPRQVIQEELIVSATGQESVPSSNVRLNYSLNKALYDGYSIVFSRALSLTTGQPLLNSANFFCNNHG